MLLVACSKAPSEGSDLPDNEFDMEVSFKVPAHNQVEGKAIGPGDHAVTWLQAAIFKIGPGGEETFYYHQRAHIPIYQDDYTGTVHAVFRLKIEDENEKFRVLFLANSWAMLDYMLDFSGEIYVGMPREDFIRAFVLDTSQRWGDDDGYVYPTTGMQMPMYGMLSEPIRLHPDYAPEFATYGLPLIRCLAKINVTVNHGYGLNDFELEEVWVANTSTKAYICYDDDKYESAVWGNYVWETDIPTGASRGWDYPGPIIYDNLPDPNTVVDLIYVAETSNNFVPGADDPFLIIKGRYLSGESSYYRLDIGGKNPYGGGNQYFDLVRNNSYHLNISAVTGDGYPTPDLARMYSSNQITYNVTVVGFDGDEDDNTHIQHVVFNDHYMLGVTELNPVLYMNRGNTLYFRIHTTYSGGWTIDDSSLPDWVSLSQNSGSGPGLTFIGIQCEPRTSRREATFTIKAGLLSCEITFTQM